MRSVRWHSTRPPRFSPVAGARMSIAPTSPQLCACAKRPRRTRTPTRTSWPLARRNWVLAAFARLHRNRRRLPHLAARVTRRQHSYLSHNRTSINIPITRIRPILGRNARCQWADLTCSTWTISSPPPASSMAVAPRPPWIPRRHRPPQSRRSASRRPSPSSRQIHSSPSARSPMTSALTSRHMTTQKSKRFNAKSAPPPSPRKPAFSSTFWRRPATVTSHPTTSTSKTRIEKTHLLHLYYHQNSPNTKMHKRNFTQLALEPKKTKMLMYLTRQHTTNQTGSKSLLGRTLHNTWLLNPSINLYVLVLSYK